MVGDVMLKCLSFSAHRRDAKDSLSSLIPLARLRSQPGPVCQNDAPVLGTQRGDRKLDPGKECLHEYGVAVYRARCHFNALARRL